MNKMPEGWSFIIELPPRRDFECVTEKSWPLDLTAGLDFEGQHFSFPESLDVEVSTQWLEENLLSVRLSLRGRLFGGCARCLEESTLAISDDLMYLYYSRGVEFGKNTELPSDDGFMPVEVEFFSRTLDVAAQVWESLMVLLPLRLLCREDCAGLCQHCGADLNQGKCACENHRGDPRFEILQNFPTES